MATSVAIPKLGMTMTEAKVVEWVAKEGDWVEKGQTVMVIETAKVTYEVESLAAGFLHILVEPETVLPVGGSAALLAETKEELEKLRKEQPGPAGAEAVPAAAAAAPSPEGPGVVERQERVKISPAAKKMAQEHHVDIGRITGTGPGGRIVKEDVEQALAAQKAQPAPAAPATPPPASGEVIDGKRVKDTLVLKGMRGAIAEHMVRSLSVSAQLTSMGEMDMTEVIKLRNSLLKQEKAIGARITYTDIFTMAIAKALKLNPLVNSSVVGKEIKLWEDINIGVAVALEEGVAGGLIVPVVKNADRKSLIEIHRDVRDVVEKARSGKLMPDDVSGSTFTLTNLGAFGGAYGFGTPIINQPEVAIFGTGGITDRPVVVDGQIVIRPIMTYSFTFDHRVIDGAPAGKFIYTLAQFLLNPGQMLL